MQTLAKLGVVAKKNEEIMGLDDILNIFANPSIEHNRGF